MCFTALQEKAATIPQTKTMVKFDEIVNSVLIIEGGFSADPQDTAARNKNNLVIETIGYDDRFPKLPCHTNKGIIFSTFKAVIPPMPYHDAVKRWVEMTDNDWKLVWKSHWFAVRSDQLPPAIASYTAHFCWGSGSRNAGLRLQEALNQLGCGIEEDGIVGPATIKAAHQVNQWQLLDLYHANRINYLKTLRSYKIHGRSWVNFCNKLKRLAENNHGRK